LEEGRKSMPETLKPNQFEILADEWVTGIEALKLLGFDPESCRIESDNKGDLSITQEGRHAHHKASGHWKKTA
jgi:hypothetical protein